MISWYVIKKIKCIKKVKWFNKFYSLKIKLSLNKY